MVFSWVGDSRFVGQYPAVERTSYTACGRKKKSEAELKELDAFRIARRMKMIDKEREVDVECGPGVG